MSKLQQDIQKAERLSYPLKLLTVLVFLGILTGILGGLVYWMVSDLPKVNAIEEYVPIESSKVYSSDDKVLAERLPDRPDDLDRKTRPALQVFAPVSIMTPVPGAGEETVDQVIMRPVHLYAVEPGLPGPLGGFDEFPHKRLDFRDGQFPRQGVIGLGVF